MREVKLRLSQSQHDEIYKHLFPGDGFEAVAIALCGRRRDRQRHCLTIRKIEPIPYAECKIRRPDRVTWSTKRLVPMLEEAAKRDLAILKIHSHPNGFGDFSSIDDASDSDLFPSISTWAESEFPHASAVMLPCGRMFGRAFHDDGSVEELHSILVPGDDLKFWLPRSPGKSSLFSQRHAQLFGSGTTERLRRMSVSVVGCSGTGSPLIEQLARLGVGRLVLVDPDTVEERNLNRIFNAARLDGYLGRPKVEVMAQSIARMGLDTEVEIHPRNLATSEAVKAVAGTDVVFGCMDGVEGRHLLNRLTAYYTLAYFDLGVKLEADGKGGISEAGGVIHYLRPDGDTLLDRRMYSKEQLDAAGLQRTDPDAYRWQVEEGYIRGVPQDRPAVISINSQIASMAVNEFLARIHPYRLDSNNESAIVRVNFMGGEIYRLSESETPDKHFLPHVGKGDVKPLLSMPELSGPN